MLMLFLCMLTRGKLDMNTCSSDSVQILLIFQALRSILNTRKGHQKIARPLHYFSNAPWQSKWKAPLPGYSTILSFKTMSCKHFASSGCQQRTSRTATTCQLHILEELHGF
ncbi:hypothetical protein OJAV_G00218900 [Oryzias javanicus]|uniref:Uncharacterized protein n=1 Tax=Oryzias javanicus TaxID=123683 RepID=A0A437C0H2_ORYJA|nr:hypothetical protein OJAV_G00218900 [Oryzias javanicus]